MLNYVAGAVGRLEESTERGFREVRDLLARMPNDYVPRRELDKRFDDVILDVADLRRLREQDERDRAARVAARDARIRSERWQRIALTAGTGMSAVGVVVGVVLHFA